MSKKINLSDLAPDDNNFNKFLPDSGWYVYEVTENGVVCYVGKGKGARVKSHFSGGSGSLLSNKINLKPYAFDWHIVGYFDKEEDALDAERELIFEYKDKSHKLYNSIYYTNQTANWHLFGRVFKVLSQLTSLYFHKDNTKHLPLAERGQILLTIIKDNVKKIPPKMMPVFEGIPINVLSYTVVDFGDYEQLKFHGQNN